MKQHNHPRLTLKTAKALAEKVLGTAKGLYKDADRTDDDIFKMQMGIISICIQYDYFCVHRVAVRLGDDYNGTIHLLFDPITLEEDCKAEEVQKRQACSEKFDEWVGMYGSEACKAMVDESCNKLHINP